MRRFCSIAVVTFALAGTPQVARAETSAPGADAFVAGVVLGATLVAAMDITFLAYDTVKLSRGVRFGTGLAITEIVLTAPQIAVGIYLTSHMWTQVGVSCNAMGCFATDVPNWSGRAGGIALTLVPTAIVSLAIVDLVRSEPAPQRSWMPTLAATPNGLFASVQGRF